MDRVIKKKKFPPKRIALIVVTFAVVFFLAYQVLSRSGTTRLKVDPSRMTISKVEYGEFVDYYPTDGEVVPITTVYLAVETGGRVDKIYTEGGEYINEGDPILRFSNDSIRRQNIATELTLLKNLDEFKDTQLTAARTRLSNKETLLDLKYEIATMEKEYNRKKALVEEDLAISKEVFETLEDKLNYKKAKLNLMEERFQTEEMMYENQLDQAEKSIESYAESLKLLKEYMESLEEKAPISGYLSSIEAEIGQQIGSGTSIGHIDILDQLKIQIEVDQYYSSKVSVGTKGTFTRDGETYAVEVTKIYSEVKDDVFKADMAFVGEQPQGIKNGETFSISLSFGDPEKSLMVKKGGFYQETGGRWAYLISEGGKTAHRANIRLGNQNPQYLEILEGLKDGDWVITSGYDTYNEADELIFNEALSLGDG